MAWALIICHIGYLLSIKSSSGNTENVRHKQLAIKMHSKADVLSNVLRCTPTFRWCLNLKAFSHSGHLNLRSTALSSWLIMWRCRRYTLAKFLLQILHFCNTNNHSCSVHRRSHTVYQRSINTCIAIPWNCHSTFVIGGFKSSLQIRKKSIQGSINWDIYLTVPLCSSSRHYPFVRWKTTILELLRQSGFQLVHIGP